eukprot:392765-Rhodomonas_salina.1
MFDYYSLDIDLDGPGTGSTLAEKPGTKHCTWNLVSSRSVVQVDESESKIGAERLAHLCK